MLEDTLYENERVVAISGYEDYLISDYGRVYSNKTNKWLKTRVARNGYVMINLRDDEGIMHGFLVHRLVAKAYVDNPNPLVFDCVNHKDENKANPFYGNLEWCDRSYNGTYNDVNDRQAKKRAKPIRCVKTGKIYLRGGREAERDGYDGKGIYNCLHGKQKTSGGSEWEYV